MATKLTPGVAAVASELEYCAGITDNVCLVTGAGQGIGEAVARALASRAGIVIVLDRAKERAELVAREIVAGGGRAVAAAVDVTDALAIERAIESMEKELGPIDVLVNAAGVLRTGSVIFCEETDWQAVFDNNATGVFLVSRAVARRMAARRRGAIVTVGSNCTTVVRSEMAAYSASKAAASCFTKCLGLELAEFGIRCNVVSPGSTDTPMQRALWTKRYGQDDVVRGDPAKFRGGIPLRKIALPDDVAQAVLFLSSDLAGHITMQELCVDGGATLRA
jgi:2,3-dihydro-2,3-dihydroxybenzoate dehydrogenase